MKNYTLLGLLITFLVFGCEPPEKHDLTLNLDVGKTYTIEQETSQFFKQKFMGMDFEMKHRFNVIYHLHVKEYDNEQYLLEFEYNDLTMEVEGSGISMSAGSGEDFNTDDTLNLIFRAFTKKPFTAGMTVNGEITFVEGIEEFLDLVISDIKFDIDEDGYAALNAFDQFIGEGGFKDNLSHLTGYLPGKPVAVREKWENEYIQTNLSNLGFSGKWENKWQLAKMDDNIANVTGTSKFTILQTNDANEETALMMLSQLGMDMEMEGEKNMDHLIDKATGLIEKGTVNARMEGHFKTGQMNMGISIPVGFEITSKIRRIE